MAACEYHVPSNWRSSRRMTSSAVVSLPLKTMRRTCTRGPGFTTKLIPTSFFSRSIVGTGFTSAKA